MIGARAGRTGLAGVVEPDRITSTSCAPLSEQTTSTLSIDLAAMADWVVCIRLHAGVNADELLLAVDQAAGEGAQASDYKIVLLASEGSEHLEDVVENFRSRRASVDSETLLVQDGDDCRAVLCRVMRAFPGCDIAYIWSDVRAPSGWPALLRRALAEDERIGAVTPLSDENEVLSPFSGQRPGWMSVEHVNRWLGVLSRTHVFETPQLLSDCVYFNHRALGHWLLTERPAERALQGEGVISALRASGWSCVACDWLFVERSPSKRYDAALDTPCKTDMALYLDNHPLGRIRHAFGEAGEWGQQALPAPHPPLRPVQLHVTHCWGGGLGRWVQDFCEADDQRHNLVLRAIGTWGGFGHRVSLYPSHDMAVPPLREWHFDQPIKAVSISHVQYRKILDEIIREFHVDVLLVSSLIGHSLDVLRTSLPTIVCAHDYFPMCPALVIRYGAVCTSCDQARLADCFENNPLNRFFRETGPVEWSAIRQQYLQAMRSPRIRMVAPSASVLRHLTLLAPELAAVPATVVPNGVDSVPSECWLPSAGRLRIVVLGSLAAHKGADLLEAVLADIVVFADVHLLGCGEDGLRLAKVDGVEALAAYRREELPGLFESIRPHVGLLLSVVPETFSYTLSELWAMGVPPVATNLGSFSDRIEHGKNGFLIEPEASALLGLLRNLDEDRALLEGVRTRACTVPSFSRAAMVNGYHSAAPLAPWHGMAGPAVWELRPMELERQGALYVDRQVPFRLALADFFAYTLSKVQTTPRLSPFLRKVLMRLLRRAQFMISKP